MSFVIRSACCWIASLCSVAVLRMDAVTRSFGQCAVAVAPVSQPVDRSPAASCHGNMGSPLPFHYLAVKSNYGILALLLQWSLSVMTSDVRSGIFSFVPYVISL